VKNLGVWHLEDERIKYSAIEPGPMLVGKVSNASAVNAGHRSTGE
jgi:hypothetical protein